MAQQLKKRDDAKLAARSLSACDYADHFAILVGPTEQLFVVHRDVLRAKSKFFRAACSNRWLEDKDKQVKLPDVHPSVFQKYLSWAYSGRLDLSCLSSADIDALDDEDDRDVARHVELYLLGDVLDDVRLRNKVVQTMVKHSQYLPSPSTVKRVWEHTPENSPMRRMIVDQAVLRSTRKWLCDHLAEYPESFIVQVAVSLLRDVPCRTKEVFVGRLPSYLEPVEAFD